MVTVLALNCEKERWKHETQQKFTAVTEVRNNGGLGQWGAREVMRSGQILDTYFVGRFADKLEVMCKRKIEVKNVLKNFHLEGWSCFNSDGKGRLQTEQVWLGKL